MRTRSRRLAIALAGLAAIGLAWFAPGEPDIAEPAARSDRDPSAAGAAPEASRFAALPERAGLGELLSDSFGPRSWAPPAPKPAAALPAKPAPPPNPYKFAGQALQDGAARVFLARGDRVYEAKQGETLEGGYRIESVAPGEIVLTNLPLGTKERIAFDSALAPHEPPPKPVASAPAAVAAAPGPPPASSGPAKPAQLRWEGPQQVRAGASFSLALHLSSEEPLRASPMQVRFDSALLQPLGVRAGKFFGRGSFSYRVNPEGSIFVGASAPGAAPGPDAEILVLTFKPLKPGATAEVSLSSLALQGVAGRVISHQQVGAFRTAIQ